MSIEIYTHAHPPLLYAAGEIEETFEQVISTSLVSLECRFKECTIAVP